MSQVSVLVEQAKLALGENDPKKALHTLKPLKKSLKSENSTNVVLIQTFAEAYLEAGNLEKAYPLLERACELDQDGSQAGSEKFFTLGQVTGGRDGLEIIMKGIEIVSSQAGDTLDQEQIDKIIGGLLSMIEIWMTDLCMEPNAEGQCQELIEKAMEISDSKSPEAWSMLASIRISQQRFAEACEAINQSWNLYESKKQDLELNGQFDDANTFTHAAYVELLQPLLTLAKMAVEMGLYEVSLSILSAVKMIDEDNLEGYYLEGFTYYLLSKLELFKLNNPSTNLTAENIYDFNEHFQDLPLNLEEPSISEYIYEARVALSFADMIGKNSDMQDEVVMELVSGIAGLLLEVGGPLDAKELMKFKKGETIDINDEKELGIELEETHDL